MEAKDYIAAIRAYGLTQVQISQKTGIPQSTISKIERGDVNDVMSRNYRAMQALLAELEQKPSNATQGVSLTYDDIYEPKAKEGANV